MKSLRRSLNSDKSNSHKDSSSHSVTGPLPTPLSAPIMGGYGDSSLSRPSVKVAPPQKVIKATHSYQSTVPQILSYQKGDFYYVTDEYPGDNVHPEGWYAALSELCKPISVPSRDGVSVSATMRADPRLFAFTKTL